MESEHLNYLAKASGAISRRDYLTALQFGLRAAKVPRGYEHVRCDAYLLLAITTLELGVPEDALAFAVGAHLAACWARDTEREQKASSVVGLVIANNPHLGPDQTKTEIH
ncbi:MAG: hypothetical protein JWN15_3361 [Firmicutes bacterium]|nr:hypothetical protein [Bacillota bacterium]